MSTPVERWYSGVEHIGFNLPWEKKKQLTWSEERQKEKDAEDEKARKFQKRLTKLKMTKEQLRTRPTPSLIQKLLKRINKMLDVIFRAQVDIRVGSQLSFMRKAAPDLCDIASAYVDILENVSENTRDKIIQMASLDEQSQFFNVILTSDEGERKKRIEQFIGLTKMEAKYGKYENAPPDLNYSSEFY